MNKLIIDAETSMTIDFSLIPALTEEWRSTADDASRDGTSRYISSGYELTFTRTNNESAQYSIVDFALSRSDNAVFTVENYVIECYMNCADIYNVSPRFMGYAHVSHHNPAEILSSTTSKDFPYVMYGSRSGENRFAVGLLNQIIETKILRSGKGGYMYYDANVIRFTRPVNGVTLNKSRITDAVFISKAKKSWFDVTKDYWNFIDARRNYVPNFTPESAYGPVWCSWLYLTEIDEEKIWATALKAKELGVKTLIIDAGWFCPDVDIPFPDSALTSDTFGFGRVDADKSKFPDMRALVDRIHALGLFVWAWATPRWVFRAVEDGEGAVDKRLLDTRIVTESGDTVPLLCTRCPDTWRHAAEFTSYLLKKYDFDGLKFDCWELDDGMSVCTANHAHATDTMGEGTLEWARHVYEAMVAVKPDAVVWFNNTTCKQYSNYSVSPNEIYCNPDENWRQSVVLKSFTNGIFSQLSEGSFHISEEGENVARQMAIMMSGHTPELQVDLTNLTSEQESIIKAYFAFYQTHRETIHRGKFTPFGFEHTLGGPISTTPPHIRIDGEDVSLYFIGPVKTDAIELTANESYVFNLQSYAGLSLDFAVTCERYTVAEYDIFMNETNKKEVSANNGHLSVKSIDLSTGAMLKITSA
jgi:Alpha-galactosidase